MYKTLRSLLSEADCDNPSDERAKIPSKFQNLMHPQIVKEIAGVISEFSEKDPTDDDEHKNTFKALNHVLHCPVDM